MADYQIHCTYRWTLDGWRRKVEYHDDGSDDRILKIRFTISDKVIFPDKRLPNPNFDSIIRLLHVDQEHLLMTMWDDHKSVLRPYKSIQMDDIRMGNSSLNIGTLKFNIPELEIKIADARQIITYF
jgi:hypothetical protein